MQGAQGLRNEAYTEVRRNDEGCSATQQMDFLRSRQLLFQLSFNIFSLHIIQMGQAIPAPD